MPISKELFLSILAMDSYNRGYGAGIADGDTSDQDGLGDSSGGNTQIGNATVSYNLADAGIGTSAQSAGFYAVAYTVGAGVDGIDPGTTIISYRGTDVLTLGADPILGGSDILNGWLAGAGLPASQTDLSIKFLDAVQADSARKTRHTQ